MSVCCGVVVVRSFPPTTTAILRVVRPRDLDYVCAECGFLIVETIVNHLPLLVLAQNLAPRTKSSSTKHETLNHATGGGGCTLLSLIYALGTLTPLPLRRRCSHHIPLFFPSPPMKTTRHARTHARIRSSRSLANCTSHIFVAI